MELFNLEINHKIYLRILVIFVVLIVFYMAITMNSLLIFKSYTVGVNTSYEDDEIITHINILEKDGKKLEIAGWAYKLGGEYKTRNSSYVIKNEETGKMYKMKTQIVDEKIMAYEKEYDFSIHAQCLLFGLKKGKYEIYVLYQNDSDDILADTGISIDI